MNGVTTGSVIKIENVDFGKNSPLKAYLRSNSGNETGFTMEVRLDSLDGEVIATFSRDTATDQGWDGGIENVSATSEVTADVAGVHTLYLVNTAGAMNFFGVHFDKALDAYCTDEVQVPWFGTGVDWLEGSGRDLLTLETDGLAISDGYCVTGVTTGSVMRLDGVDFGQNGPSKAYLRGNTGEASGFTMEIRLDSYTGPVIAILSRDTATDQGWDGGIENVSATSEVTADVTGVHTLYLVNTSGAMNFFGVHFDEKEPPEEVEPKIDAYTDGGILVQNVGTTVGGNVISIVKGNGTDGGYVLQDMTPGTIIEILGVNFGTISPKEVILMGNTGHNDGFDFELRLDSAGGPVVGHLTRDSATSGGWSSGADQEAARLEITQEITGIHNLYLVLKSGYANFYGIAFYQEVGEADQLPPEKPAVEKVNAYEDDIFVSTVGIAVGGDVISVVKGNGEDGDYIISNTGPGTIIEVLGVSFGTYSPTTANLFGNTGHNEGFVIEMRLDRADGPLVGTFTRDTPTSGGWSSGADQIAASFSITQSITGVHNLYLVYVSGYANFYGISFESTAIPQEEDEIIDTGIPYVIGADAEPQKFSGWILAACIGGGVVVLAGVVTTVVILVKKNKKKGLPKGDGTLS